MTGRPRVLLVGHDASRTGAPRAAATFLRWLADQGHAEVSVLLLRGGPLAAAFGELGATRIADTATVRGWSAVAGGLTSLGCGRRVARRLEWWRGRHRPVRHPDLLVANTVAAWPAAAAVRGSHRLVCWVHELDHVAHSLLIGHDRAALIDRTDHFLAAGEGVRTMLVDRWGVGPDAVTLVPEPVEPAGSEPEPGAPRRRVLGVGSAVPRKGADAFLAALAVAARDRPDLDAAWIGMDPKGPMAAEARRDVCDAGLSSQVRLVAPLADLSEEWRHTALLLHAAREDPCPLAVLEAAQRGIPTVTWDTGGAADEVRAAGLAHLVAPAGDLLGLAARLGALLDDEPARRAAGEAMRSRSRRHLVDEVGPMIWDAVRPRVP